ncbi:MAG: hypothetical protein E7399_04560 [Ruminococcaceae bacterium]|nr:hypothetical protein [Oscillospiraceae bacterium]
MAKKSKNFKYGRNALLFTCLVLAIMLFVNLIITEIVSVYPLKADMTRNKVYALTEDTKRILNEMKKDVSIYLIESEKQPINHDTIEVIDRYRKESNGRITVESVDISENPTFAKKFDGKATLNFGTIVIACDERVKTLNSSDFTSSENKTYTAENKLTNAILYVMSEETQNVYLMTGHGEKEFGIMETLLNQSFYTIQDFQFLNNEIPEDAKIMICIAPKKDFSAEEIEKLDQYLENGGNVQFYFDVGSTDLERLYVYLKEWGIQVNNDYLYESDANRFYGSGATAAINIIPIVESYAFTEGINQNALMIVPFSSSLTLSDSNVKKATVLPLLSTSEKAYSRTDFAADGFSSPVEGDTMGYHTMSALSIMEKDGKESNVMVTGTSQLLLNSLLEDNSTYANGDYFLNSIAWMSQMKDAVKIRAKSLVSDALKLTVGKGITYTVVIFVISILVLIVGLVIWARRRFL